MIKNTKVDCLSDEEESDIEEQQIFDEIVSEVGNNKPELLHIVKKLEVPKKLS